MPVPEVVPGALRTAAVRGGMSPASHHGAVSVPIYQTATFERAVLLDGTWDYSRIANPTRSALEECLAGLEGACDAVATASGMAAALLAVLTTCDSGSHVVLSDNLYGGTWDLFTGVLPSWGVDVTVVDLHDEAALVAACGPRTRLVWVETPSNPLLKVTDIAAVARVAHAAGARLLVDSTFATPALQQPLALGADLVLHSTTKYLNGHSDVTGGALLAADPALAARARQLSGMTGCIAAPFDSWLVLRGIRTLAVRMQQVSANALEIAGFLAEHPRVSAVHYPGLAGHPDAELTRRQMTAAGGALSFELDATAEETSAVCARTKLFTLAVSLGGVESLIQHPAQMTHCTTSGTPVAVPPTLLRLAVGLEAVEDQLADLDQALAG